MPTVGWILEDAIERFWEGQPKAAPVHVPRPVFVCKRCGKKLYSAEDLRCHFNLEHPLELPALYVRGEPLLRESVLRAPVKEGDVELVQCTRCEVQTDGSAWCALSLPEFRRRFAQPDNSTWNVRLIHERALDQARTEEEYHIRFRIPGTAALNTVDAAFVRTLVLEELRHSDLEQFQAHLPSDAPAREYGGALGDYALGIILKERKSPPHAPVGFEEFAVKMRSALEVLILFNRPVALAVSGSIRFNLNDFHDHGTRTASELETGLRFFRDITGQVAGETQTHAPSGQGPPSRHAICPVDRVSHCLLSACDRLVRGRKLSLAELEGLRQLTRGMTPVSEQDLAKVHVICAEGYLRLARANDAVPHLRAIQFDPSLKAWAQRQLNAVSPHGN